MTAPPFVGLTGGIGAGKSEALAALGRLGAATISTDEVVHELYDDPEVAPPSWRAGATRSRRTGGSTARAVARPRSRPTRSAAGSRGCCGRASGSGSRRGARSSRALAAPRALVVETPLLFEAGLEGNYDATIAVVADEAVRAERAGARGHEAVDERTARQLTQAEKAARATYAVENSGSLRELEQELSGVLAKLTS